MILVGEHLGKYEVLGEVGQGGMSVVYRGRDTVLQRPVAIKVLHDHLSKRADSRQRFEREALAVAKLSHPNIVQIFDFSTADSDQSYIVTEFLEGVTLREFIERQPLDLPELAAVLGLKLCDALAHAHALGIIHRDIKPENVMVCRDGTLKLMDFGIAQVVDSNAMTVTGTLLGSPAHMSPEMIEGSPLDFRADIFSMGTLLYFAATSTLPFTGRNPPMVLKAILDGSYAEAEMVDPKVGRGFSRVLDKCLARDPDARYATVEELSSRLRDFLHESEVADPEGWWQAFYHEPATTARRLRAHVLAALERRGREALKARRTAAALAHFNRVLAIEPEHEAVLKLIRRLDQRRKVYFYAGALAALGLTVAVAFAVSAALERADEAALQPVIVPPVPSDPRFDAGIAGTAVGKDLGTSARRVVRVLEPRVRFVEARDVVRFQLWEAVLHAQDLLRDPTVDPPLPTEERNPVAVVVAPEPRPDPNKTPDGRAKPPLTEDADAKPSGDPGLPTPTPPALVAVRLSVFPPRGTKLSVEGRVYSDAELGAGLRLPPGLLRYELTHEHYKPQRGVLNTNAAKDGAMSVRLAMADLKPAVLQVACDDPGASVLVFDESNHQILGGKVRMPLSIPVLDQISAQRRIWFQVIPSVDRPPSPRQGLSVTAGSQYTPAINVLR